MKRSKGELIFDWSNHIIVFLISLTMVLPFMHLLAVSFSNRVAVESGFVFLLPIGFNFSAWNQILARADLWQSMKVTIFITIAGTFLALLISCMLAYPLSKSYFLPKKIFMRALVFTMIFKAPIIPYFLVVRNVGLYNNILALIIPGLLSAYNVILLRTFFMQLPVELEEAAKIDGCHEFGIFTRIILPLSKPVLATVGLFYAVGNWNVFTKAMLFIRAPELQPLQIKLRQFITNTEALIDMDYHQGIAEYATRSIEAATIIFATIPIILVYPYLQKYFIKGALLGSVKE